MTPRQRYSTLAWRLISSGQWDRVLAVARDWLAEEPDCTEAHQHAAQSLVNLERYREAHDHARQALMGEPGSAFLHRLASIACFSLSLQTRAEHHAQEAIRLGPFDAMNWYHLARMRYNLGAHDAARRHAQRSLELSPNNPDTINLLALCERADPARQYAGYQRALELDPENAVVHNNLGVYHLNVHQNADMAAAWFRRALQHDPSDRDAQRNLVVALRLRDPIHRFLQFPRRLVMGLGVYRGQGWGAIVTRVALWAYLGYAVVIIYGLWLIVGFPLFKAYERLTLPDVREQAGVVGARRGGPFRFWRWPRWVRVGLLFLGYGAVWWAAWRLATDGFDKSVEEIWSGLLVAGFSLGLLVLLCRAVYGWSRTARRRFVTWRGERKLQNTANGPAPDV